MTQQTRSGHPYHMFDAIHRQPQAMAEMLSKHETRAPEVAAKIKEKRRLYLVGIGTSWHAALVAEHWFRRLAPDSLEVQAWHSFEFHSYPPRVGPDDAVLVISHRGTKTYSFLALEQAKAAGAYTISITSNQPGQRIQAADDVLHTVDAEVSAAFTVSYTSALVVLGMLAAALDLGSDGQGAAAGLAIVPAAAGRVLESGDSLRETAERFQSRTRFICAAAGPNTANAYEVALKMKETSRVDSEGFHVEQLLHGPFCEVDSHCLVTLVAPPGPSYRRAADVAQASAAVDAAVWALVEDGDAGLLSSEATEVFRLPAVDELWSPLLYVIPLQLFTYYLALARGTHPDLFQQDNPKQAAAKTHYDL